MPPRIQGAGPSPQNRCSIAAKSTAEEKRERERERERERASEGVRTALAHRAH